MHPRLCDPDVPLRYPSRPLLKGVEQDEHSTGSAEVQHAVLLVPVVRATAVAREMGAGTIIVVDQLAERLLSTRVSGLVAGKLLNLLSEDDQWAKLRLVVETAREVWR